VQAPPLPDGVLVQSTSVNDEGEEAGWRVWADGRHEGRRAGAGWIAGPRLGAAALDELRAVLDEPALEAMAGVHEPSVETEHSSTLWLQVTRPGGPLTVALVGGARLDALDRLTARLMPILSGGAIH
jgi:hypothetical protein